MSADAGARFRGELLRGDDARVVERAAHGGQVLEHGVLAAALREAAARLALEIRDDEVVSRDEHLPQVIVAVQANREPRRRARRVLVDHGAQALRRVEGAARGLARLEGELAAPRAQCVQRRVELAADRGGPFGEARASERLRIEARIARLHGERAVQVGRARRERVDEQQVARVIAGADLAVRRARQRIVEAALEIAQRVFPAVALILDGGLHERDRRRLGRRPLEHDRAGRRRHGAARRALREKAAELPFRMRAAAQPPIRFQEQLLADDERHVAALGRVANRRLREPLRQQRAQRSSSA